MPLSPRGVSSGIVVVLALQLAAVSRVLCTPKELSRLPQIHLACPPATYPFVDYPMFRARFRRGERLEYRRVVGVDEDGGEHRLAPRRGADAREIDALADAALRGDPRDLARRLGGSRAPGGAAWSSARIEDVELVLGREGFVEVRNDLLAVVAAAGARP